VITATIIQRSKCAVTGKEIVTFELVYPRMIHAELMTHRMFSRNSASSRAIPIAKVVEMVRDNYAEPSHWGKNQPGMQAREELDGFELEAVKELWCGAAFDAARYSEAMAALGAHKQVANRVTEPYQWMKVVLTYTEGNNWFWLRDHTDADPTIHELARKMWEALEASTPFLIHPGEWHVPYVNRMRGTKGLMYLTEVYIEDDVYETQLLALDEALAVSSSCCAQVSYRTLDLSLSKAQMIYGRLVDSEPVHASPFEHQATPMKFPTGLSKTFSYINTSPQEWTQDDTEWEDGVTHLDREDMFWSGNFCGYVQHRQLIPNNVRKG
jgi:thymidylate synthase ThyX